MRRTTVVAVATLLLVSPATRGAGAPDVASEAVILLERWSTAVRDHRPGRLDDHLKIVTGFTYDDRRILDQPMKMFLSALSGRRYETGTEREQKVYRLAQAARAPIRATNDSSSAPSFSTPTPRSRASPSRRR